MLSSSARDVLPLRDHNKSITTRSEDSNVNDPSSTGGTPPPVPEPRAPHIIPHHEPAFWHHAITGLFVLGIFYTLYVTRAVLLPVIIAALLSLLLAPVNRALQRLRIPGPAAAGIVVLTMIGGLVYGISILSEPASKWLDSLPKLVHQLEGKLSPIKQTVLEVNKAADQIEKLATPSGGPKVVAADKPGLRSMLLVGTQSLLIVVVMIAFLVYFFLGTGDMLLRKLVKVLPRRRDKIKAVQISQRIQQDVSRYLVTVTLINSGLGGATGLAMYVLHMPNAILWGVMVATFNFVPYIGATISLNVLTAVSLLTFDGLDQAVIVPVTFLAIATIEGQLVTPIVLGRQLALNSLVVFLTIIWWGWFWGIPGALIAVPLLVIIKIICDHVDGLNGLGEFLGR